MINETYKNVLFGVASLAMVLASISHSKNITENLKMSEDYYHGFNFSLIVTCLFVNVCLGIFSFFILGNMNDYIHRMCVNLIGAGQKLRVLALLILLSMIPYAAANFGCFVIHSEVSEIEKKLAIISLIVVCLQVFHLFSIHLLHPDIFGLKWIKRMRDYDKDNQEKIVFL